MLFLPFHLTLPPPKPFCNTLHRKDANNQTQIFFQKSEFVEDDVVTAKLFANQEVHVGFLNKQKECY